MHFALEKVKMALRFLSRVSKEQDIMRTHSKKRTPEEEKKKRKSELESNVKIEDGAVSQRPNKRSRALQLMKGVTAQTFVQPHRKACENSPNNHPPSSPLL